MQIQDTPLDGLKLITPRRFCDNRGFLVETWNAKALAEAGIALEFVQDNHSMSVQAGTLRGLHFQAPPHAQDKLVRCTRGSLYDIAVDIRRGSPTYGKWFGITLNPDDDVQILIPKGFLHGFVTLQPDTEIQYKCSDYYVPESDRAVRWDSLGIEWPLPGEPILSAKDAQATLFADFQSPFLYGGKPGVPA